jgi:hypothetical protein
MATILESMGGAGATMGADLQGGIAQLSADQQFTFTLYARLILPADGFVFFAPAITVTPPVDPTPADLEVFTFSVNGSLHVAQRVDQQPENVTALQDVTFTTKRQLREFSDVAPGSLYVMTLPNGSLVAFSVQRGRYDQAGIWHYTGRALLPFEATQFIATPDAISLGGTVVSNSLPIWMAMGTDELPVYPAMLSPLNFAPPYITADIQGTQGIGQTARIESDNTQSQLAQETVRFTFYGLRNDAVMDFQQAVNDNSLAGVYGIMNIPVPVDEKQGQSEFGIIAQKKTMELQVNYYQARTRDIARKLIESAFISINTQG